MARDFTKVSSSLWRSKRFLSLTSLGAKLTYNFLLTGHHQVSAGVCYIPDNYLATDLDCTVEDAVQWRSELIEAGLIHHDAETDEVFIDGWYKHNPPMNEKHSISISKAIERVESDELRAVVTLLFEEADAIRISRAEKKRRERELAEWRRQQQVDGYPTSKIPMKDAFKQVAN